MKGVSASGESPVSAQGSFSSNALSVDFWSSQVIREICCVQYVTVASSLGSTVRTVRNGFALFAFGQVIIVANFPDVVLLVYAVLESLTPTHLPLSAVASVYRQREGPSSLHSAPKLVAAVGLSLKTHQPRGCWSSSLIEQRTSLQPTQAEK